MNSCCDLIYCTEINLSTNDTAIIKMTANIVCDIQVQDHNYIILLLDSPLYLNTKYEGTGPSN